MIMLSNPFTPVFGGKPDFFFGREELIGQFDRAIVIRGSDYRSLFVTGVRGSGKTALLEQLSIRVREKGWRTIDVGAENALASIIWHLAGSDEVAETTAPALGVNILGSGISVSGVGKTKTTSYSAEHLDQLLLDACGEARKGVFVSIDEVQKISPDDIACICEAFQMASRKGKDVILVLAGLPASHDKIIHQDGCTFMRRAPHEELGLLSPSEVRMAFHEAFALVRGIELTDGALERLVKSSSGHPYMIQLLGYQLIEYVNGRSDRDVIIDDADVNAVEPVAKDAYERRSLQPLLNELSGSEVAYLRAMARTSDAALLSSSKAISEELGKSPQQTSASRRRLLDKGIIVSAGHGVVRFNVPFLRTYMLKPNDESAYLDRLNEWEV